MQKLVFLIPLALILLASPVYAQGVFQSIHVTIDLENNIPKETYFVSLTTTQNINGLTFQLNANPENIVAPGLNYTVQQIEDKYFLVINKEIPANTVFNFNFSFVASDLLSRVGNNGYLLNFIFAPPTQVSDFRLRIILPKDSSVIQNGGVLLLSRPVDISTNGERISLEWNKTLAENEEFAIYAQYTTSISQDNIVIILVVIIALAAVFVVGYKLKSFKKEKLIEQILSEDEKKVVNYIKQKGEIMQEDIKTHLDWSKTKVSKVIRNLEVKNIIHKTPHKKTNRLKLK